MIVNGEITWVPVGDERPVTHTSYFPASNTESRTVRRNVSFADLSSRFLAWAKRNWKTLVLTCIYILILRQLGPNWGGLTIAVSAILAIFTVGLGNHVSKISGYSHLNEPGVVLHGQLRSEHFDAQIRGGGYGGGTGRTITGEVRTNGLAVNHEGPSQRMFGRGHQLDANSMARTDAESIRQARELRFRGAGNPDPSPDTGMGPRFPQTNVNNPQANDILDEDDT